MCWFMAGRVLVRFLRTAVDANQRDTIMLLQSQISFVRSVLNKAGERVPLACESYIRRHSHHTLTAFMTLQTATARC